MITQEHREMAEVYEYMMKNPTLEPHEVITRMYGISMLGWPFWPEWAKDFVRKSTSKRSTFRLRFLDMIFCELEINGYLKIDGDKGKQDE